MTAAIQRPSGLRLLAGPDAEVRQALTIGLVCLVLLFGGGGPVTPIFTVAAIELAALLALCLTVATADRLRWDPRAIGAILLVVLIALTIVAQLAPIDPSVWRALPGRAVAGGVRDLLGLGDRSFPFTLDPDRTRAAGYALLPPVAAFFCTLHAGRLLRVRLLIAIVAVALLDLVLGTLQLAARGTMLTFYNTPHAGAATGLFANRNHNADLLLIAPLLVAGIVRGDVADRLRAIGRPLMIGALVLFLFGVLTTTSRMGLLLGVVPLLGVLLLFSSRGRNAGRARRRAVFIAGGIVVAAAVLATLAMTNDVAGQVIGRFETTHDQRADFWPDVLYGIGQLWPFGSGTGTFDAVFRSFERLDTVTQFYVNHAHNDYLETAFELGAWGACLIAIFFVLLGRTALAELAGRQGRPLEPLPIAALFGIVVLLLHSLVDYPLRTYSLATLFGVLCGLLFRPALARP